MIVVANKEKGTSETYFDVLPQFKSNIHAGKTKLGNNYFKAQERMVKEVVAELEKIAKKEKKDYVCDKIHAVTEYFILSNGGKVEPFYTSDYFGLTADKKAEPVIIRILEKKGYKVKKKVVNC